MYPGVLQKLKSRLDYYYYYKTTMLSPRINLTDDTLPNLKLDNSLS